MYQLLVLIPGVEIIDQEPHRKTFANVSTHLLGPGNRTDCVVASR